MKIEKTVLDHISMPYAVSLLSTPDLSGVLFASEDRGGPCRLYHPGHAAETLWTSPGGVMNVIPDGDAAAVWSIRNFFPVFQSAGAEIVRSERETGGQWTSEVKAALPYVHRIARFMVDGIPHLLACSLCAKKDFEQDWSYPGAVYVSPIVPGEPLALQCVVDGLTKNHGLSFLHRDGNELPVVSSANGVLALTFGITGGKLSWTVETIFDQECSEAVLFDIDGDGTLELATIEGFHGDAVRIYKRGGSGWRRVNEFPVTFGHVLWVGTLLGRRCVLSAGRGGDKETRLHFPKGVLGGEWEHVTVDAGVGASQIAVCEEGDAAVLYASNHGANEVAMYRITE